MIMRIKHSRIKITDKEWEAIKAGAVTEEQLNKILNKCKKEETENADRKKEPGRIS